MTTPDIVKGTIYNRGQQTLDGEKKYMSLISMIVASDKPLIKDNQGEVIFMGSANLSDEINNIQKYKWPYKPGEIGYAIIDLSRLTPNELKKL